MHLFNHTPLTFILVYIRTYLPRVYGDLYVSLPSKSDSEKYSNCQEQINNSLDYLEIIIKHRQLLLKVIVLSTLLSVIIVLQLPKVYSSTALILPPQQDNGLMSMMLGGQVGGVAASLAGGMLGIGTPADQYASMLESDRISDSIIDKFKLMDVYKMDFRLDMYKKLGKLVEIKAGKKNGIISITVEDEIPKRAADIANAYVEELGILSTELSMTAGGKNKQFIEKRLIQSRADLAKAEDEIKRFQAKNKSVDVSEQAKASIAGIAELRAQLTLLEVQLAALSRRFTDNSQEVKDTKASIVKIKLQLAQLEGNSNGGAIPTLGSLPNIGQEYMRLIREFKIQETLVELLTKQFELAKLTEDKNVDSIQIIQKARPADKKIKPKRAKIVIVMTFFSLIATLAFIFLRDYLNRMPINTKVYFSKLLASFK